MKAFFSAGLAAILSFTIASTSGAWSSTIQTIDSTSCQTVSSSYVLCGFAGGSWLATGAATVYVDGTSAVAKNMQLDLIRYSYTGTRTESVSNTAVGTGTYEVALSATQMATNPSPWDYYMLGIDGWPQPINAGANYVYGVAMVSR